MGRLKTGVKVLKKLITVNALENQEISEYAEMLGWSKSRVHEEMRNLGRKEFRKRYIEPILKEKEETKKAETKTDDYEERKRKWHEYLRDAEGRGERSERDEQAKKLADASDEALKKGGFEKKGEL